MVPNYNFVQDYCLLTFLSQTLSSTSGGLCSKAVEIFEFYVDFVCGICTFFGEHELGAATLLDFELAVRLADNPPVVELAAGADVVEKGHKVPAALGHAGAVVAEGVNAGVLHSVRNLHRLDLLLRVLFTRQVVFFH